MSDLTCQVSHSTAFAYVNKLLTTLFYKPFVFLQCVVLTKRAFFLISLISLQDADAVKEFQNNRVCFF